MKLGRMMNNDKRQSPFEDGINRSGRTQTSSISNVKIALYYKVLGQVPKNLTKYCKRGFFREELIFAFFLFQIFAGANFRDSYFGKLTSIVLLTNTVIKMIFT